MKTVCFMTGGGSFVDKKYIKKYSRQNKIGG